MNKVMSIVKHIRDTVRILQTLVTSDFLFPHQNLQQLYQFIPVFGVSAITLLTPCCYAVTTWEICLKAFLYKEANYFKASDRTVNNWIKVIA